MRVFVGGRKWGNASRITSFYGSRQFGLFNVVFPNGLGVVARVVGEQLHHEEVGVELLAGQEG